MPRGGSFESNCAGLFRKNLAVAHSKAIVQVFSGKSFAAAHSKAIVQVFFRKNGIIPNSRAIIQVFGAIFAKWLHFGKKTRTFERLSPSFWKKAGF
jgi:hypothetical protein